MLFFSDNPDKNGPKIEAKLRKELSIAQTIPFEVDVEGTFRPQSAGQFGIDVARDLSLALFGSSGTRPLYTFRYQIPGQRAFEVHVPVIKAENRLALGALVYIADIGKPVTETLALEDERMFGASRFKGTSEAATRLNGNKALLKQINRFLRTSYMVGQLEIRTQRYVTIEPHDARSTLRLATTPRSTWFGISSSFDARAFVAIADAVEATL